MLNFEILTIDNSSACIIFITLVLTYVQVFLKQKKVQVMLISPSVAYRYSPSHSFFTFNKRSCRKCFFFFFSFFFCEESLTY